MLIPARRVPAALAAAAVLGLGTTAATAAAATTAPATGPLGPAPFSQPLAPQVSTLPNGDLLSVTGSGPAASIAVFSPDGHSVPAIRYAPNADHAYVIPNSVLASGSYDPSLYDIPALHTAVKTAAVIPHYPLHILQIGTTGLDGAPADATTFLIDADDVTKWSQPIAVAGGVGRVAVPAGHYTAFTIFDNFDPATRTDAMRVVTQTDLTVADTGVTALTADERTATSQVNATAPKPTATDSEYLSFSRMDQNHVTGSLGVISDTSIAVSPAAAPQAGGFTFQLLSWGATSPASTPQPYRYDVMFPATDHIDANQTYAVDTSKLETVHNTIDTDAGSPRRMGEYMFGPYSPATGGFQMGHVYSVPTHLTTYIGAPQDGWIWNRSVFTALPSPTGNDIPAMIMLQADRTTYSGPGEQWRTWGHGPMTAQVGQYKDGTSCRACADGSTVDLGVNPFVDSEPDTTSLFLGPATGHTTIYRDGTQVFSQDNTSGAELTGQAQTPGTYRLVFDLDLSRFPITQSTATHTDLTVPYTPKANPDWNLPAADYCGAQGGGTTPCSILPVLNLGYRLATDDTNTSHGPVQTLDLQVGHQSYSGVGANARATGATVSVSFDKGATWTKATVVPTFDNHFLALWPNSGPKGGTPWLKVGATDALGGSITQTVANAYTIG
ncbi:hypothetical protein [Catenulispora subtropica]|uniref:Uncharacterized protein n=1 Tax=Catenulispora subtropica TaxID=450798 RepID=A0ABP5D761_9ACTN